MRILSLLFSRPTQAGQSIASPLLSGEDMERLFTQHKGHPGGKDCPKDEPMRKRYCNIHDAPAFAIMARALGVAVT